jgi:hypothetical protein
LRPLIESLPLASRLPVVNFTVSTHAERRIEDELLLRCVRWRVGNVRQSEEIVQLAKKCVDWGYVISTARAHGITALVAAALIQAAPVAIPADSLNLLRQRAREIAVRNLSLTQELLRLVQSLSQIGVKAIPFKGPILAAMAYQNVAMREFLDLDILVPKAQLAEARELLLQQGYQQAQAQAGEKEPQHVESQLGCDFFRPDGRISVELHWSFLQKWLGFEVDLARLWQAHDRFELAGTTVRSLPADITLLYLCAHGTKHRWSRLCWVVDIERVLRRVPILDWNALLVLAERIGCRRNFFLGFHLVHQLLDVPIPLSVERAMRWDINAAWMARRLCMNMFRPSHEKRAKQSKWRTDWFYLRSQERLQDRLCYLRFFAQWLFLPSRKDREWVKLPTRLAWLYVVLRPFRVLVETCRPRLTVRH